MHLNVGDDYERFMPCEFLSSSVPDKRTSKLGRELRHATTGRYYNAFRVFASYFSEHFEAALPLHECSDV
jgi:hypothetical protein